MNFKKPNKRGNLTAFLLCMGPEPALEQEYVNTQVTSPDEMEKWLRGPSTSKKFNTNQDEIQKYCLNLAYEYRSEPYPEILAEEIYSETCIKILKQFVKKKKVIPNIAGYMKKTARNYWKDVTKKRKRGAEIFIASFDEMDDAEFSGLPVRRKEIDKKRAIQSDPVEKLIQKEFWQAIYDPLSEEERQIIEEYVFSNHGNKKEIAKALNISQNALYQKMARIKKKAREAKKRYDHGDKNYY